MMSSEKTPRQQDDPPGLPEDVSEIRAGIRSFLRMTDSKGRRIGSHKYGVYAFYDYDDEPIYVGQTLERLSSRISRHLTNQRTDAVAMNVLDPFEVASIEVWPLDDQVLGMPSSEVKTFLNRAEYTVFENALGNSKFQAILNEKPITVTEIIELPTSYKSRIIPDDIYRHRKHPDIRIARRAQTIANLARVISEREVSSGLRVTLLTQARRLEHLASERLAEFRILEDAQP